MNFMGLNGFGYRLGRISPFFQEGFFPFKFNWTARHIDYVISQYHTRFLKQPYILAGFSDGGTLAHEVASVDPFCVGLIVHSGMWRGVYSSARKIPVLLLRTVGDPTPTYKETGEALCWYSNHDYPVKHVELHSDKFFKHEFANGLSVMKAWCWENFQYDLKIAA